MNFTSRFNLVTELEETSGNNTIFKFWEEPLIDFEMQSKFPHVKDISIDLVTHTHSGVDQLTPKLRVEFDQAHGFSTGDQLKVTRDNVTAGWSNLGAGTNLFAQVINTTEIHLSEVATPSLTPAVLGNFTFSALDDSIYDVTSFGFDDEHVDGLGTPSTNVSQVMRGGPNGAAGAALLRLRQVAGGVGLGTASNVRLKTTFNDGTHTTGSGTANQTGVTYFLKPHTYDDTTTSFEMYTDSGLSTPATINEPLITTATKAYTSSGTVTLQGQTYADWGISDADKTKLRNEVYGYARVFATDNSVSGTFTGKSASTKTIGTSRDFTQDFFIEAGSLTFNVKNKNDFDGSSTNVNQDFIIGGSSPNVTITIEFIETAKTDGGWYRYLSNATTDDGMIMMKNADTETFEVKQAVIYNPGNTAYKKQTGASTFVAGARYKGISYLPNSSSSVTPTTMPPDNTIAVNSDGFITGISYSGTYNDASRGTFTSITSQYLPIIAAADTYSAPALTTAEAEDVFDMDTEWDSTGFDTTKIWPNHILPTNAVWTYNQPNQTSVSQNGTKYVRNFGVNKWQVEFTYPPMTADNFRKFHSRVQKAKGQFHPFYFEVKKDGDHWLFGYNNLSTSPNPIRFKSVSNSQILVEGFPYPYGPVPEGSLIIAGVNNNGQLHTITNEEDANRFGEIKFRLAYAPSSGLSAGDEVYMKPSHMIVSLSEDGFEYNKDTADRYQFTVKFDLDEFK